jgi:hypothetical protein
VTGRLIPGAQAITKTAQVWLRSILFFAAGRGAIAFVLAAVVVGLVVLIAFGLTAVSPEAMRRASIAGGRRTTRRLPSAVVPGGKKAAYLVVMGFPSSLWVSCWW